MSTTPVQHAGRIARIDRLTNTVNGNPRFSIVWYDLDGAAHTSLTQSDASITYAIGNRGLGNGDMVRMSFTKAGRIFDMEPLTSRSA